MGKVKETMKQIGIRDREKTCLNNAQCLMQWLAKTHPEVLDEYTKSKFYKILFRTNKYSSILEAMYFLRNGKEE